MPKLNPKNIKNKVKNTQKYLQNPPKMGPKSLPRTLLGALLQKVLFFPQFSCQWSPNGSPEGAQKSPKITKTRKKRVLKRHLKSVPQKASKINDLGSPRDLPDRAETRAGASFSLIHPITKSHQNCLKNHLFWRPWGHQNHKKSKKVTSRKQLENEYEKILKNTKK